MISSLDVIGTHEQIFILKQTYQYNPNMHLAFLDLKKAYDTVDREKLLQQLLTKYNAPTYII